MAYVPPALRRKRETAAGGGETVNHELKLPKLTDTSSEQDLLPSVSDIQKHFWPTPAATLQRAVAEEVDQHHPTQSHSTLNGTADSPNVLRYILLFKDANPRWDRDGVIFVKTNLNLLSRDKVSGIQKLPVEADTRPLERDPALKTNRLSKEVAKDDLTSMISNIDPIMVFHQQESRSAGFHFLGYYKIGHLEFLEPGSEDLVHMLEQKFTLTNKWGKSRKYQRDPDAWKKSLSYRWAVLKLEKDVQANKELKPPVIQASKNIAVEQDKPKKSVNEMLQEMRLGSQGGNGTQTAS